MIADITLQATGLVHEVYLRLAGQTSPPMCQGRRHFFGAAAEAMRHILIDEARRRKALKRGGGWKRHELEEFGDADKADDELLGIHEALLKLEDQEPEVAEVVRLHFFSGLTFADVAECLDISPRTAHRRWDFARAWLRREMKRDAPDI